MDRFVDRSGLPAEMHRRHSFSERNDRRLHPGLAAMQCAEFREFDLRPVVGPNKQGFGSEAVFCVDRDESPGGIPKVSSQVMLDNWLLYGFDELIGSRAVFLSCTRETLLSGYLSLLPHSAIIQIQESLTPEEDARSACRSLKAAGYRFALDDFGTPEKMDQFLDLADFIKVDFRHSGRRERACMLRRLRLTKAILIAENIESEEEFQDALEEGFELFQGNHVGEHVSFAKKRDALGAMNCVRILEALYDPAIATEDLVELINLESGIECRLLRRANWVTPASVVINTSGEALDVVEKADVVKLVTLAMMAASQERASFPSFPHRRVSTKHQFDLLRSIETDI